MKSNLLAIALVTLVSIASVSCSKTVDELQPQLEQQAQAQNQYTNGSELGGDRIVFTQVVKLDGLQEVPNPVITETKGIAILRVSESKKLYSKVIIQKLAEGDALRFAHIHAGATGVNGPVRIGIADNAADFGINKEFQLTDAQFTLITSGAAYVNAHSNFFPAGIVRGQIR